jgi:hypothetical protein
LCKCLPRKWPDNLAAGNAKCCHFGPFCLERGREILVVDLYLKVRLARRGGMSERAAADHFGISRASVNKMMSFSVPPGYQRVAPIKRPKLDVSTGFIDQWLQDDLSLPRKQRHTAKRIFECLRDDHQFRGGQTTGLRTRTGREGLELWFNRSNFAERFKLLSFHNSSTVSRI